MSWSRNASGTPSGTNTASVSASFHWYDAYRKSFGPSPVRSISRVSTRLPSTRNSFHARAPTGNDHASMSSESIGSHPGRYIQRSFSDPSDHSGNAGSNGVIPSPTVNVAISAYSPVSDSVSGTSTSTGSRASHGSTPVSSVVSPVSSVVSSVSSVVSSVSSVVSPVSPVVSPSSPVVSPSPVVAPEPSASSPAPELPHPGTVDSVRASTAAPRFMRGRSSRCCHRR